MAMTLFLVGCKTAEPEVDFGEDSIITEDTIIPILPDLTPIDYEEVEYE